MSVERRIAEAFAMDDATWARHANPWSVWTRNTALPVLVLAFWSRTWLGWWSLIPIAVAVLWTWYNPRIFPAPASLESWASKAVLGERVWMNRREVPVPQRHRVVPNLLSGVAAVGSIFVIWGVIDLAIWPTVFGAALVYLGKLWFLDRMVWLFEDVREAARQDP